MKRRRRVLLRDLSRGVMNAPCGVMSAPCGVMSDRCGVMSAQCGVMSAQCGVMSAPCGSCGLTLRKESEVNKVSRIVRGVRPRGRGLKTDPSHELNPDQNHLAPTHHAPTHHVPTHLAPSPNPNRVRSHHAPIHPNGSIRLHVPIPHRALSHDPNLARNHHAPNRRRA